MQSRRLYDTLFCNTGISRCIRLIIYGKYVLNMHNGFPLNSLNDQKMVYIDFIDSITFKNLSKLSTLV